SYTNLSMENNNISNIQHLLFGGPQIRSSSTILAADAPEGLNLQVSGVDKLRIRGNLVMHAALDTNSYAIIGNSDERLKREIVDDEINSLEAIKQWRMAGFYWIDTNKPQERQFSVIAQSAPEITFMGDDGYLNVNTSKQISMNSHAVQQLALQHEETNKLASEAYINTETNAEKIERLEKEIQKLKEVA